MGILDDPLDARNARQYEPRLAPAPGGDIAPTGATWDHPFTVLWNSLPPEVRQSYKSLANFTAEMSPGAAVRDVVDESGNMVKAAQSGDWIGAGSGPAKMAVAALGVMPFLRSGKMTSKTAQEVIRAYHGSPHDFDKFNASKIGTGEGAESFGHGLYFAENEDVARGYRDRLAGRPTWANLLPKDVQEAIPPGRMYEVNIHADPARFIAWDKPLSEQSGEVRKAIDQVVDSSKDASVIREMISKQGDPSGEYVYRLLRQAQGSPAAASQQLAREGVPGIRYLDQISRGEGQGTSNTVVFPTQQEIIEILRKYGMAPVAAGGAAATVPSLLADDQGAQ